MWAEELLERKNRRVGLYRDFLHFETVLLVWTRLFTIITVEFVIETIIPSRFVPGREPWLFDKII